MIKDREVLVFFIDELPSGDGVVVRYAKSDPKSIAFNNHNQGDEIAIKKMKITPLAVVGYLNEVIEKEADGRDVILVNQSGTLEFGEILYLLDVLHKNDHHAFLSPRLNVGDLKFPFSKKTYSFEESFRAWEAYHKQYLPEYETRIFPNPNFVIIKGKVLQNLGGFNDKYVDIYSALIDMSMRWNRYGYSSIVANQCYFRVSDSLSGPLKIEEINHEHPEYKVSLKNYNQMSMEPMDFFSENISSILPRKRIVFYFLPIQPIYNGTSEYAFALINSFVSLFGEKYEISILIQRHTYIFFKNDIPKGARVIFEENIHKNNHFDLVFCPVQLFEERHLPNIFSLAPRNIGVILDVIALRSMYICGMGAPKNLNALFIELSDGILSISESSLNDTKDYFKSNLNDNQLWSFVHLAGDFHFSRRYTKNNIDEKDPDFLKDKYILIFGNSFKHKSTREVVNALRDVDVVKVVIGDRGFGYNVKKTEKFIFLPSGSISETLIQKIYANAHLLVFPSQYEGFGLPIFKAIQNCKKIFVYDSDINHEIEKYFVKNEEQIIFFKKFLELKSLVESNLCEYDMPKTNLPSWDDVARETNIFIEKVLEKPIDPKVIRLRWYISKLWQNKEIAEHEISIRMLANMFKVYLRRKFKRYSHVLFK